LLNAIIATTTIAAMNNKYNTQNKQSLILPYYFGPFANSLSSG